MLKQIIEDVISACDDGLIAYEDESDKLFGILKRDYTKDVVLDIMENDHFVAISEGFFIRYFEGQYDLDDDDDEAPMWLLVGKPVKDRFEWIGSPLHYVDDYTKQEIDDALLQATTFYRPRAYSWD